MISKIRKGRGIGMKPIEACSAQRCPDDDTERKNRPKVRAPTTDERCANIVTYSGPLEPCSSAVVIKRSTFSSVSLKSREESCSALSNGKSSTRTVSSARVKEHVKTPTRMALEMDASAANTIMQPISPEARMISKPQMRPGTAPSRMLQIEPQKGPP